MLGFEKVVYPTDIVLNLRDAVWTDPDTLQGCIKLNERSYHYFQVTDRELLDKYEGYPMRMVEDYFNAVDEDGLNVVERLNDIRSWFEECVCVDDYDSDEIGEVLSSYGYDEAKLSLTGDYCQLVCECMFETDFNESDSIV